MNSKLINLFEGYLKVNPSETIIIDVNKNEIIFYYKKDQGLTYIVKYLEKDTNETLIDDKVVEGNTFKDEISETSVNIDGYIAEEPTSQTIVIGMNENVITFYYTKRADLEYTIKYINKDTNEEIKERVVKDNQVFNSTVTEVAPNITGYNSINNEETITITTGENEIIFYYEKLQGLVYTVKYLEKDTEVALANEKVVDKNEFEDIVTENAIDIAGYKAEEPKTQSIVIGIEENKSSLKSYGVNYEQIDLIGNDFDTEKIVERAKKGNIKLICMQRSKGYAIRKSLSLESIKNIICEIRGGAGGEEAALFAGTLFRMYSMYAERKGFKVEILNENATQLGGYKERIWEAAGFYGS